MRNWFAGLVQIRFMEPRNRRSIVKRIALGSALICCLSVTGPARAFARVTLTSPTGGETLSGTARIAVQISSDVSWVNFYVDGHIITASPPYTKSWDTTTYLN